jgi:hypothetical protein
MKRVKMFLVLALCSLLVGTVPAQAAVGSVVVTVTVQNSVVTLYTIVWTSSSGGAVSGNTLGIGNGDVFQVQTVPSTSAAPTDLYDLQLKDSLGSVNILGTAGDNLSTSTSKIIQLVPAIYLDKSATFDLVIANAGDTKSGTVYVWVRR